MKNLVFILLFFNISVHICAESKFTFKGEIIDYKTTEKLPRVLISFYSGETLVDEVFSDINGYFEFTTTKLIDIIEVEFVSYLTMKIINVDVYNKEVKDFFLKIPLFNATPMFISYVRPPTFSEIRKEKKESNITKGVRLDCKNKNKALIIRYKKKVKYSNKGGYQFVEFTDLINCEK